MLALRAEAAIDPAQVERVEVDVFEVAYNIIGGGESATRSWSAPRRTPSTRAPAWSWSRASRPSIRAGSGCSCAMCWPEMLSKFHSLAVVVAGAHLAAPIADAVERLGEIAAADLCRRLARAGVRCHQKEESSGQPARLRLPEE